MVAVAWEMWAFWGGLEMARTRENGQNGDSGGRFWLKNAKFIPNANKKYYLCSGKPTAVAGCVRIAIFVA